MYYPSEREFLKLAKKGNLIPVYREFIADMETPVSAFNKIDRGKFGYLLESVEGGEHIARYSFLGSNPSIIFKAKDGHITLIDHGRLREYDVQGNPLDELSRILGEYKAVEIPGLPRFSGGAVGYVSYDAIRYIEKIPCKNPDDLDLPDLYFVITDTILIFDHINHTIKVVYNVDIGDDPEEAYKQAQRKITAIVNQIIQPYSLAAVERIGTDEEPEIRSNFTKNEFEQAVEKSKEYIRAGDIFQVVLSQRFEVETHSEPFNIYRALRSINPSPYMYYLKFNDLAIVGSSPEILVRCEEGVAEVRPIAGTRPRGATPKEDEILEKELLADPKERAEHIMLVDLGRNDLGRVCDYGTVRVEESELMFIERYSHVMHIVSNVTGKVKQGNTAFDVFKAAFPAGTVSGAPKIRAMEIIDELEKTCRGPYAGSVGYFSFSGNLDMAITIRTIVINKEKCYVQAGAGLVADSVPEMEYQETKNKARGMMKAIGLAETF
jgi:anthranilate synthase component 1